jgi:uncharacterized protein YfaS (alpha-2-macroglobulin family)
MAYGKYSWGSVVHLEANFKRPDTGAAYDPDAVELTIIQPDGTQLVPSPNREAEGRYVYEILASMAGTWEYRFDGTGTLAAGGRKAFTVEDEF